METREIKPLTMRLLATGLRLLPAGMRGKARLARILLRPYLSQRNVCIEAKYGAKFLVPSLAEPLAFHILVNGLYEPLVVRFLRSYLEPGMTFIDVGANIGFFAILAAQWVGPKGRVLAIEPSFQVFPYLEFNISINGLENVQLIQCAAYDRDITDVRFWEAPADHFGMGALAPQFHTKPVNVMARRLDTLLQEHGIRHVDVIKVDVEGFEAFVFRGAETLLKGAESPIVLFEFCDWAEQRAPNITIGGSQEILMDWGYRIWRLQDYFNGLPHLPQPLRKGYAMLVARKVAG